MNVNEWTSLLIQDKVCNEESLMSMLTIIGAVSVGANIRKVAAWIGCKPKDIKDYWKRLERYHYFNRGKVCIETGANNNEFFVALILASLVAEGMIKRTIK